MRARVGKVLKMKSKKECERWCRENAIDGSPKHDPCLMPDMPFGKIVTISSVVDDERFYIENDKRFYTYTIFWFKKFKINI